MGNFKETMTISMLAIFSLFISCQGQQSDTSKPNVILIMADDIGFECLSINGSTSYKTPVLDSLARNGVNFTKAISQPLCTPSRVKIMTGKFNYKNYDYFTYLNPKEKTFGNLFQENGYKTAIVGKWQLNGIAHQLEGYDDNTRPYHFGFDEYSLWQLTKVKSFGERFANPLIEQNGKALPRDENAYGPDVVSDYAVDFIKRNKDHAFFLYYPMLLVHSPFVPTPDSPEWLTPEIRSKQDNRFFCRYGTLYGQAHW
jgi:arylsulfatase A